MPYEYGHYFAWGETERKEVYDWSTYKWCNGHSDQLTKYCYNANYGYNSFTDNLTILHSGDDAATVNWGEGWRTPTKEQWVELKKNTTCAWTTQNDVYGLVFYGNGQSLFLPAAGVRADSGLHNAGSRGYFWSSSLITSHPFYAWSSYFGSGYYDDCYRCYGLSVRAVRAN